FSTTWIEMIGTEGALLVDDSHRDVVLNTMEKGMQLPMSTMPGERVDHTYAVPMAAETIHFLEAVAYDRPVMVAPEHARMVMEIYMAADVSAERNESVTLPLKGSKSVRAAAESQELRKPDPGLSLKCQRETPDASDARSSAAEESACSAARSRRAT